MKALEGIRVVDFSRILAGPFSTMILGDLGAEVIKIERPKTGDDSRAYGPFVEDESLYFMSINRNKKSIALNLKNKAGLDFVEKLIATADVVVENFRPGVMKKFGFDYESLSKRYPRLVYCSCSGYGSTGENAAKPAYDLIIQGLSGIMSLTGRDAQSPTKVGFSIADIDTGIYAALGIITALYQRHNTGKGQYVDIAMYDCMLSLVEHAAMRTLYTGTAPLAVGNRHTVICPFASFQASDGLINICAGNDNIYQKLCIVLGDPELGTDPRFITNDLRIQNWDALNARMTAAVSKRSVKEWCAIFDTEAIPAGPINDLAAALDNPQIADRQMIAEVDHPVVGKVKCVASALHLSGHTPTYTAAPVLGADTAHYVQSCLGCSLEEAEAIAKSGAFE